MAEVNGAPLAAPWKVRWVLTQDVAAVIDIMTDCEEYRRYTLLADDLHGGQMLVEVQPGAAAEGGGVMPDEVRGYVWFDLGRPETWVRSFAVARAHRGDGVVFRHLAAAFLGLVLQHGSQGIGGFQVDSRSRVTEMFKAMGGSADPGVRVWGNIKTPPPLVRAYMERLLSHVDGAF